MVGSTAEIFSQCVCWWQECSFSRVCFSGVIMDDLLTFFKDMGETVEDVLTEWFTKHGWLAEGFGGRVQVLLFPSIPLSRGSVRVMHPDTFRYAHCLLADPLAA